MDSKQFEHLGDGIRVTLQQEGDLGLPAIAATALREWERPTELDFTSIAEFLRGTDVEQQPGLGFSDLPLVVYCCEELYIEALVWTEASTTIHQHARSRRSDRDPSG